MRNRATLLCEHTYAHQSLLRRDVHNIEPCGIKYQGRATLLCENTYAQRSSLRRHVHYIEPCEIRLLCYVNIPMHLSHLDVEMYIL